jgi:hypothetical protein
MTCAYAERDGAYVLGALSAAERLEFEHHLADCKDCSRAVRQLAGLPGLLSRVDATVLDDLPLEEPVPEAVLAKLVHQVRRIRRRRVALMGGAAAAAVAAVLALVLSGVLASDPPPPAAAPAPAAPAGQAMTPVGGAPVHAKLALEPVTWGTRLDIACTYEPDRAWGEKPDRVTYTLFVRTRDGHTEQVGTWRSLEGRTMHLSAATAANRKDIASVEVRTADGRPVLELTG